MKKVLFVFEQLQVNGAAKSLVALLNAVSNEYDVSLFLFSHDGEMISELPSNVKLLPEIAEYKVLSQQMKVAVAESIKRGKFALAWFRFRVFLQRGTRRPFSQWKKLPEIRGDWDVVCSYADGFVSNVVINKVVGGKKVLWVHENYEDNPKSKDVLESFVKADAIVGVSRDAVNHLSNLLGPAVDGKLHVVHNIVNSRNVKSLAASENVSLVDGAYNLVSVGRVSYEKGYDLIPTILQMLVQRGLNVHWSIIGSGLPSIKDSIIIEAQKLGVDGRIHFLGEKANPHPYTKVADCFVQLSRHEGWCMTITEALALGVPVVVSDLPVFHEQVVEGTNGYFAHDVESFANAIQVARSQKARLKGSLESPCSPANVTKEFSSVIQSIY